jgi:matrixin
MAHASAGQSTGPRALDVTHPVTYFVATGSERTGFLPSDRQLAQWALEAWQRASARALGFEPAAESDAIVRLYWAERSEGQFGEMQPLVVGGRPGAAVYIRPDMESFGPDIARRARGDSLFRDTIVYLTCLHELGHALGLVHTRDFRDVMYFFGYGGDIGEFFGRYRARLHARGDIANVSGLSTGDVGQLRALYGG